MVETHDARQVIYAYADVAAHEDRRPTWIFNRWGSGGNHQA